MRISRERGHTPISNNDSDEHNRDRDRRTKPSSPRIIEADVADAIESMIEGNEQERDIDSHEPRILKEPPLNHFKGEARGSSHFGREMFNPEVHDQ